jgi:AraC-like DNA-binding protein
MRPHTRIPPAGAPIRLATTSVDVCEDVFQRMYGRDVRIGHHGDRRAFGVDLLSASFGDVQLTHWTCSGFVISRPQGAFAQISMYNEGEISRQSSRGDFRTRQAHTGCLIHPGEVFTTRVERASGLSLRVPMVTLLERAEKLTGRPCDASLFDRASNEIDLRQPLGDALMRTAQNAVGDFADLHRAGFGAVATIGYEDLLLNLAACAIFPHIAEEAGHAQPDCGPEAISRVRDYICAHSDTALELSMVAATFGMSLRALQENFRRYYGCSPRDQLIDCRLDKAHRLLRAADGALSVSEIALRCGFSDHKHFSAKYRDRFMESPSATRKAAARR